MTPFYRSARRAPRARSWWLCHLLPLVMLTACGDDRAPGAAKSGGAAGPIDACQMLADDDLHAALGSRVVTRLSADVPTPKAKCDFRNDVSPHVTLFVFTDFSAAGGFRIGKREQGDVVAVAGVGDDAYWNESLHALNVLKGSVYFVVQFHPVFGQRRGDQASAELLARQVLRRLPR